MCRQVAFSSEQAGIEKTEKQVGEAGEAVDGGERRCRVEKSKKLEGREE